MQKARDLIRIVDIKHIELWVYLYFENNNKYPESLEEVKKYFLTWDRKIPIDPKNGEIVNWCTLGYNYELYKTGAVSFRLSACFEHKDNLETKAKKDEWIYDDIFEVFK